MCHDENFHDLRAFTKGKEPELDLGGKGATPFPEEKVVIAIYGGRPPRGTARLT
jgi:hypothetical protein